MGLFMDPLNPEQRHKCMSHIKSKDTSIENLFRKALWREGIRYRKNYGRLPGKPDIAITKSRIAIFCDGEFWHGKDWNSRKDRLQTNRDYWIRKIERNIDRDDENDLKLERMGWTVFHFWGQDIKKHLEACIGEVKEKVFEIGNNSDEYNYYYEQAEPDILAAADNDAEYGPDKIEG
jgi:DNA mismatch endonuclease (patch repair protein)